MSDYGFATYDGAIKSKLGGVVSSKYPVFGPKYDNLANMYRTIHIIDNAEQPVSRVTDAPSYGGSGYLGRTSKTGSEKKLIVSFRHGLGYRPVGYAYISGKVVKTVRSSVQQWADMNSEWEYLVGGDFGPLYANNTTTTEVYPSMKTQMNDGNVGVGGALYASGFTMGYPTADLVVPKRCAWTMNASDAGFFEYDFMATLNIRYSTDWREFPYSVEIDEEYVKIYRRVCWAYYRYRKQGNISTSGIGAYDIKMDLKGIEDYSGTELDITFYLCPYRMEDLL